MIVKAIYLGVSEKLGPLMKVLQDKGVSETIAKIADVPPEIKATREIYAVYNHRKHEGTFVGTKEEIESPTESVDSDTIKDEELTHCPTCGAELSERVADHVG